MSTRFRFATSLILLLLLPLAAMTGCKKHVDYPNVILISIDTLRADRLGCYGYTKGITGMMDFWAERGVRFEKAYATSPWTLPSHASAMTSLYPTEHRAIDEKINIDIDAPMLAEQMKKAGFNTAAFVSHYYLSAEYGFDRGFNDFYIKPNAKADEMIAKTTKWLKANKDESFFVFLHLFDPHTPYQPPPDYAKKHYPTDTKVYVSGETKDVIEVMQTWPSERAKEIKRALSALYDGEIDFVDNQLEVLFKWLQQNKLDQNTVIILMADHGEEFMEHGMMEHGFTLYEEQVRVPFLWYFPAGLPGGKVVDAPVSLVDLMPTLLDFLGLPPVDQPISGKSLMPAIKGEPFPDRYLLTETTRQGPDRVSIIKDGLKYMYSPEFALNGRTFGEFLFNLKDDPAEETDLMPSEPDVAGKLSGELFSSGLYIQRRAWHVRWGQAPKPVRIRGQIGATPGKFIYIYKANTIYGTDERGLMTSLEYPLDKKDPQKLQFLALCERDNGVSFMTEPETGPVAFHFFVEGREQTRNILLGNKTTHPGSGNFTLSNEIKREPGLNAPSGGILIWNEPIWVNSKQILRAEVGDPIQLSPEVIEQLRSLGYLTQ
ncbi:MAG TPA: sulfatase [bacterium]|nr:sulfatase [bacterium]